MLKYIKNLLSLLKTSNQGFIALLVVIMVTSLIIVSSVIIALVNTSNSLSNYQVSEAIKVSNNIDACLDDALWRISSSTTVSGSYSISTVGVACAYQISSIMDGYKYVTSTATTTSAVGNWNRQVIAQIAVSTTPISIYSYRDNITRYNAGATICGDGVVEGSEVCDDGDTDTEGCGDGTTQSGSDYCNSSCSAVLVLSEVCDDGGAYTESCGDSIIQSGSDYCNATCSATLTMNETCEYNIGSYYCGLTEEWCGACMDGDVVCPGKETASYQCLDCRTTLAPCLNCE
ncbi:MAG: hypothetical protein WC465_01230 [Patescibacteria group bacterium]